MQTSQPGLTFCHECCPGMTTRQPAYLGSHSVVKCCAQWLLCKPALPGLTLCQGSSPRALMGALALKCSVLMLPGISSKPCWALTIHTLGTSPTTARNCPSGLATAQLTGCPKWPTVAVMALVEQLSQEASVVWVEARVLIWVSCSSVMNSICKSGAVGSKFEAGPTCAWNPGTLSGFCVHMVCQIQQKLAKCMCFASPCANRPWGTAAELKH